MSRPDFITYEDITRWSESIDSDPNLSPALTENPIIREVLYSGAWLLEQLEKAGCPDILITRIQYTAGRLCFGRDPWEVHSSILIDYLNNTLVYEPEPNQDNN